jgi:hypothetical protein
VASKWGAGALIWGRERQGVVSVMMAILVSGLD